MTGFKHLPVAGDGLPDLDPDGLGLGVAQLETVGGLELILPGTHAGELDEVRLHLVGGDVKGLAELQAHLLVLRGMVDAVLADELGLILGIPLIDAHHALGQGQA